MRFDFLIPLVSLIPMAGALINRPTTFAGVGLAWAALLGFLMLGPVASNQNLVLGQIPLLLLLSFMAVSYSKRQFVGDEDQDLQANEKKLTDLKRRHGALKVEVVAIEKEESQSLQIYGVAKSLAEALSWREMSPRLTSAIQKIFGAYEFLLYALDDQNNWTLLQRRGSWAQEPPIQGQLPDQVRFFSPTECSEVVPVLTIPIYSMTPEGLQLKGALFMKSPIGEKSELELQKIGREFGEQLGLTLSKALLFSQMEEHSRVDGLTGVLRRQAFMERIEAEFKRTRVFHTPFSLMMIDIDHFKAVNDAHGHAAGDAVLKRIGELLKGSVYETDVVGRYGGEEFLVLLPKAQPEGVRRKAESLRQRIEKDILVFGFDRLQVTVSIGLSHHPQHGQTAEQLIREADRAMYQAKETGRNRVIEA